VSYTEQNKMSLGIKVGPVTSSVVTQDIVCGSWRWQREETAQQVPIRDNTSSVCPAIKQHWFRFLKQPTAECSHVKRKCGTTSQEYRHQSSSLFVMKHAARLPESVTANTPLQFLDYVKNINQGCGSYLLSRAA